MSLGCCRPTIAVDHSCSVYSQLQYDDHVMGRAPAAGVVEQFMYTAKLVEMFIYTAALERVECIVFSGAEAPVIQLVSYENDVEYNFSLTPIAGASEMWTWDTRDAGVSPSCNSAKFCLSGGAAGEVLFSGISSFPKTDGSGHATCPDDMQWYSPEYSSFARETSQESRTAYVPEELFHAENGSWRLVTTRSFDTISWRCDKFVDTSHVVTLLSRGSRTSITDLLSTAVRLGCIGTYNYGTDTASLWLGQIANTEDKPATWLITTYEAHSRISEESSMYRPTKLALYTCDANY
jgi:hypothetical protein